jgi:hypothetical protein
MLLWSRLVVKGALHERDQLYRPSPLGPPHSHDLRRSQLPRLATVSHPAYIPRREGRDTLRLPMPWTNGPGGGKPEVALPADIMIKSGSWSTPGPQ